MRRFYNPPFSVFFLYFYSNNSLIINARQSFIKPLLAVKGANLLIFKQGFANKPPFSHAKAAATLWGRASHAPAVGWIYARAAVGAPPALSAATMDGRNKAAGIYIIMCKKFFCFFQKKNCKSFCS